MVFGTPSIAQLVERRTVECVKTSLGRWFESGSKERPYDQSFPDKLYLLLNYKRSLVMFSLSFCLPTGCLE